MAFSYRISKRWTKIGIRDGYSDRSDMWVKHVISGDKVQNGNEYCDEYGGIRVPDYLPNHRNVHFLILHDDTEPFVIGDTRHS